MDREEIDPGAAQEEGRREEGRLLGQAEGGGVNSFFAVDEGLLQDGYMNKSCTHNLNTGVLMMTR